MSAIDIFYRSILFFNEQTFVFIFLLSGYFFYDKKTFTYVSLLTLFTTIFNSYLKSIWLIPLSPELGSGCCAYPSGHTQSNIVLWLSFILLTRKFWLVLCLLPFFIGNYFGMIHFKYHTWPDIFGGICAGLLTIVLFYCWIKLYKDKLTEFAALLIVLSLIILVFLLPEMPYKFAPDWRALGGIIGLLSFKLNINLKTAKTKVINILISLVLIGLILKGINIKGNPAVAFIAGFFMIIIPLVIMPKIILHLQQPIKKGAL